mgnify:CR=1 FL=1
MARPGVAGRGQARRGKARGQSPTEKNESVGAGPGRARQGMARPGWARLGAARVQSTTERNESVGAWLGLAGLGPAGHGKARRGAAWQGSARQGCRAQQRKELNVFTKTKWKST